VTYVYTDQQDVVRVVMGGPRGLTGPGFTTVFKSKPLDGLMTTNPQADDPDLQWPVEANSVYVLDLHLILGVANENVDFECSVNVPVGTTGFWSSQGVTIGATSNTPTKMHGGTAFGASNNFGTDETNASFVQIYALVRVGATPGVVVLSWSQATAQATPVTLKADSFGVLTKVA